MVLLDVSKQKSAVFNSTTVRQQGAVQQTPNISLIQQYRCETAGGSAVLNDMEVVSCRCVSDRDRPLCVSLHILPAGPEEAGRGETTLPHPPPHPSAPHWLQAPQAPPLKCSPQHFSRLCAAVAAVAAAELRTRATLWLCKTDAGLCLTPFSELLNSTRLGRRGTSSKPPLPSGLQKHSGGNIEELHSSRRGWRCWLGLG